MGHPIEPTPPLCGEDAEKLLREIDENTCSPAEMRRRADRAVAVAAPGSSPPDGPRARSAAPAGAPALRPSRGSSRRAPRPARSNRSAAEIIDLVALNYSVSPQLLLALLEYQSGALTQPEPTGGAYTYPLGYPARDRPGLYLQLIWAANQLNDGYYRWRMGKLTTIDREDGRMMRFDRWLNAATTSLQVFFNILLPDAEFDQAISPTRFAQTYQALFGHSCAQDTPHIPASLAQPPFLLPFETGYVWAFTGGPHTGWGTGEPLAALDFAPPLTTSGCQATDPAEPDR